MSDNMNLDQPVVNASNGKLTAFGKWAAGLLTAWVLAISSSTLHLYLWRSATESNRYKIQDAKDDQDRIETKIDTLRADMRSEFSSIRVAIAKLPPEEWRERIRELEKWRLDHIKEQAKGQ